jgi:hypothetical protein
MCVELKNRYILVSEKSVELFFLQIRCHGFVEKILYRFFEIFFGKKNGFFVDKQGFLRIQIQISKKM